MNSDGVVVGGGSGVVVVVVLVLVLVVVVDDDAAVAAAFIRATSSSNEANSVGGGVDDVDGRSGDGDVAVNGVNCGAVVVVELIAAVDKETNWLGSLLL